MKKVLTALLALALLLSLAACAALPGETWSDSVPLSSDSLRELNIDLISGELNIYLTDGASRVDYTIKKGGLVLGDPQLRVRQSGHKTTIDTTGYSVNLGGYFSCDIDVYIPHDVVEELSIEMTSGETSFADLALRDLNVLLTSGRVDIENVTADTLDFEATSGSADIWGSFDSIDVDVTSGSFDVSTDVLPSRINCEATSGNIDINIPRDAAGFTLYYERTSGKVSSAFETSGSSGDHSGSLLYGDGSCMIEVDITSGSVTIGKN